MAIILYSKVIWTCLGGPFFSGHGVCRRCKKF